MNFAPFDPHNRYTIHAYTSLAPFSSFLPGIAGPLGIPMWVFYVNRGQAITSFGIESKNCPIMEFQPANKAYLHTPVTGFRTFLKILGANSRETYEPFSPWSAGEASREMFIGLNELEIQDVNAQVGLQTNVVYFTIPGENYAGLARSVTINNIRAQPIRLEILDGMPALVPYGVNNSFLKEMGRTSEAWMEVFNLEAGPPFYRVRASLEDKPEVETFEAGHFALAFVEAGYRSHLLPAFVDPNTLFAHNTALSAPIAFYETSLEALTQVRQITGGKTPCAFFGAEAQLQPAEAITIHSIYGHMNDVRALNQQYQAWTAPGYLTARRAEAKRLAVELTDAIQTHTSSPIFDGYCSQTFLDNVLRGGWPLLLGQKNKPYHIYSRKHGDPERDYNAFFLAAEFYSQGNGNYRDVNQNRRCEVFFNPDIGPYDITTFMSLIQADGYNPLVVQGSQFSLPAEKQTAILALACQSQPLKDVLSKPFTPGKLLKTVADYNISLQIPPTEFLDRVIEHSQGHFQAAFGEGYWIDHWTYNLDLIESYLSIYPERKAALLFDGKVLPFYDSAEQVNPRPVKYCLTSQGPRQLNATRHDAEKAALIASRTESPHLMRSDHGRGEIYRTDLFTKLAILALVKFTTLDPWGMGIEMEAGKPGWYDAMNGLPGLFGSSMPETYELKRLLKFLIQAIQEREDFNLVLPLEVYELLEATVAWLDTYNASSDPRRQHIYWDGVTGAREAYRQKIRLGFDGEERSVAVGRLVGFLEAFLEKIEAGIQRAVEINQGLPPTYFAFKVESFDEIPSQENDGTVHIHVQHFQPVVLPLFLEGFVHALKGAPPKLGRELFKLVRASQLYDRKLAMYKVNASLEDQPHHIGRARAFTPGWLENESIWLHMAYKYLLEVLKAGLYPEFFQDFKQTLIPFQDPEIYHRSPLENSSFLVSSVHPDESIHGAGFVARLSGSTAEFLSIWQIMMAGQEPFTLENGELRLRLAPILPGWLFTTTGQLTFKFLGRCNVTYHNPGGVDTFSSRVSPQKYILHAQDGLTTEIQADVLGTPYAEAVRSGQVKHIDVYLEDGGSA